MALNRMIMRGRRDAALGGIFAALLSHAAIAQTFASSNALDIDGSGTIEIAYFSFSRELEHRLLAADQLQRADDHESVEVFVVLVEDWAKAGLANAGLISSLELRDQLDAMVGSKNMIALYPAPSDYTSYDMVLFALTEMDGRPVSDDCLISGVSTTLYEGVPAPTFDMVRCMEESD